MESTVAGCRATEYPYNAKKKPVKFNIPPELSERSFDGVATKGKII